MKSFKDFLGISKKLPYTGGILKKTCRNTFSSSEKTYLLGLPDYF